MSRTRVFFLNAKVNILFFAVNLVFIFFSRKVFLNVLGPDFLGLSATITNILFLLTILEFGFSTATTYSLYKPLFDKNYSTITSTMSLLGSHYRKVGWILLGLGSLILVFAPLIFRDTNLSYTTVVATFLIFLLVSSFEYFFNHQQILLLADQKRYLTQLYLGSVNIAKLILQIVLVRATGNVFYFLACELFFAIVKSIALRLIIQKTYPWLRNSLETDADGVEVATEIRQKSKQIFVHQIAELVLGRTDLLLVFVFTNLKLVAYYTNYVLIVQHLVQLINQTFVTANSGIGNLIASRNQLAIKQTFDEFLVVKYWISGIAVFCLFEFTAPFITLWLGQTFLLKEPVFILLLINSFIIMSRQPVEAFLQGFGLFHDTWAAATEALINLFFSLLLGYYWGISGILSGTLISLIIIVYFWKPYLLFSQGFHSNVGSFFFKTMAFVWLALLSGIGVHYLLKEMVFSLDEYMHLILKSLSLAFSFILLYTTLLWIFFKESRAAAKRLKTLIS